MDQKWMLILGILVFYHKLTSGAQEKKVKEGQQIEIYCKPKSCNIAIWFRVLDNSEMEFIAYVSNGVVVKGPRNIYSGSKLQDDILTLKSFNKATDSGIYSCVCIKSNELKFGNTTRLVEASNAVNVPAPTTTTTKLNLFPTTQACACKDKTSSQGGISDVFYCTPIILGPLVGACGLLLLLLIVFCVYCNQIRTRRCPHHYKRKPRTMAPGKQMMTNRHV
ncbi:T-cell surface glycoprotein CD8 alpha chain [Channa argus]|uniref:T-cell surface glycoprotein CD8 alpha chain n=1 Tax=Channa argus TaxID=215402 RepID=UPI003522E4FE